MRFLSRTKEFLGVISSGRLLLYRESNPHINEKIFDTVITLTGSNITVEILPDNKKDIRFTLTVATFEEGKRKEDTYEVRLNIVIFCMIQNYHEPFSSIPIFSKKVFVYIYFSL